jgi:hypothetical protein
MSSGKLMLNTLQLNACPYAKLVLNLIRKAPSALFQALVLVAESVDAPLV